VWDENRKQIVVARDSELQCIDPDSLEAHHTWQMNIEKVTQLDISNSGDRLLVAGGEPGHRGRTASLPWPFSLEAHAIDLDAQSPLAESAEVVLCARWLSDASGWVEADWEGKVCARDSQGRERLRFQGHTGPILTMCLLEGDAIVATAGVDASIKFWELTQGRLIASLNNHTDRVFGLAPFSHEDRPATAASPYPPFVSVSTDHTVRLWNWKVGRLVRFARLATEPRLVAWSPKRLQVAVALEDHTVVFVDMGTLKVTLLADERRDRVEAMLIVPNPSSSLESDRLIVWRASGARSINLSPTSRD
jgi:WD40 repeat protein